MSLSTAGDLQGGLPPCSMGIYKGESPLVRTKGLVLGTIGPLS